MSTIHLKRAATLLTISVLAFGWMGCNTEGPTGVPIPDLTTEGKPTGGGGGSTGGSGGGGKTTTPASFGGNAFALKASAGGSITSFAKTAPLPAPGGASEASSLEANLANTLNVQTLTAQSLHATIVAQGDRNRAESSASDFSVSLQGQTITASFLMSRATVLLSRGRVTGSGISRVENLTLNGQPVVVTGQFNQQVSITGWGYLLINEQHFGSGYMTVRALHIMTPDADVVVSEAFAGMTAGSTVCGSNDFATGGGWLVGTPSGARGSFGVAGGMNPAGPWGHLELSDASGSRVHGTGVTSYVVVNSTSRHIDGTCDIDGQPGTYSLDLTDNGDTGTSDTFNLMLSNGYQAAGTLNGGNVQLHVPCR